MKLHTVKWHGSSSEEEVEIQIEAKDTEHALDKAVNLHRHESHTRIDVSDGSSSGQQIYDNPCYTLIPAERGQDLADIFSPVNKLIGASANSIKQSLTSIKLPKVEFQDSGWILLYRIAGWLCIGVGILVLIAGLASDGGKSSEEGFVFFCCALLAASANFFAAHILRLQEKTAAFTEVTAGIMEKHHELMVENVNLLRSIAQKTEDKG